MKKHFFIVMAIAFANVLLLTSCEKEETGIVGTWATTRYGASRAITPAIPETIMADITAENSKYAEDLRVFPLITFPVSADNIVTMRFGDNGNVYGKYAMYGDIEVLVGTYTYTFDQLVLKLNVNGTIEVSTSSIVIAGKQLTMTEARSQTLRQYVDSESSLKTKLQKKSYYKDLSKYVITEEAITELLRK